MSDRTGPARNGRQYDYGVPNDYDDEPYPGRGQPSRNGVNGQNGQNGYGGSNGYGGQNGYGNSNGHGGQNGYGGQNGAYGQGPAGSNGGGNGYGGAPQSGRNGGADGSDYYSGNYDYSEPYDYFGSSQARRNGNGAPVGTAPGLRQPAVNFPGPNSPLPPPPAHVSSGETMRLSAYSARLMDLPGRESRDERLGIPPGPSGGRAERRRAAQRVKRRRRLSVTKEIPILVGVALLIALVLKTFLVQAFVIPSGSMEQTIRIGDRVLVDKLTPWFGTKAERGDVVVFEDPGGWLPAEEKKRTEDPPAGVKQGKDFLTFIGLLPSEDEQDLIKRVIAVGGDEVKCCDAQGKVTVNGKAIEEPYVNPGNKPSEIKFDVRVPAGRVFVMGDHRANSADSRFHLRESGGTVPEERVQGRAIVIAWPFDHWGKLEASKSFTSVPESSGASAAPPIGGGHDRLTQYPIPAELPLVMGVVGLSRLWDRRQWIVRSDCGGLGGRRSFRFRRERERGRERYGEGDP